MTKSKSSTVTRDILYLTIDTFLDVVVKKNSPLGWYLSRVVSDNSYLPGDSNENALCLSSTGNVFVTRWVIPLVTIPLLDFVMIFSCRNTLLFIILETVLRHFCQAVGIDYQDTMVNWTPIPEDCMEQLKPFQHAFKEAIDTNKFLPSTPKAFVKDDKLSEDVKTAITNAMPYYLKFKERSFKFRS